MIRPLVSLVIGCFDLGLGGWGEAGIRTFGPLFLSVSCACPMHLSTFTRYIYHNRSYSTTRHTQKRTQVGRRLRDRHPRLAAAAERGVRSGRAPKRVGLAGEDREHVWREPPPGLDDGRWVGDWMVFVGGWVYKGWCLWAMVFFRSISILNRPTRSTPAHTHQPPHQRTQSTTQHTHTPTQTTGVWRFFCC